MIAEDKQEKERIDARNALEEYVYDLRSKIQDEDQLGTFVVDSERDALCRTLDETENWLYEEGEECNRQVYSDGLSNLKVCPTIFSCWKKSYLFQQQTQKK